MKDVLRVLHVGVANRGIWPLERCRPEIGFQSAALCDVNPEALAHARELTGLPELACFSDIDVALEESDVDCVIICVPTKWHVPFSIKAIERGLPVLVEKGMTPDWASARRLVRRVDELDARLCVAQNYRYFTAERALHAAIHDESHPAHPGRVQLTTYTQNRVRPVPATLIYPFASVWDMSCHHFDTMMYLFGPIDAMSAFSWGAPWSAYEHDNNTAAHSYCRRRASPSTNAPLNSSGRAR